MKTRDLLHICIFILIFTPEEYIKDFSPACIKYYIPVLRVKAIPVTGREDP
jgi:hypothetical protein